MVLLLSLIWIISFNGIFVCLFRRRFEETLTLSLMCGALVLYVFSFFSALIIAHQKKTARKPAAFLCLSDQFSTIFIRF